MGQFDSRTEASQARLDAEGRATTGLLKVPGIVLDGGSAILDLLGSVLSAVSPADPSVQSAQLTLAAVKNGIGALRTVAGQRFESRVQYLLNSVVEDLKAVMKASDQQTSRLSDIESKLTVPRFTEILTEAAIQAARATTDQKLRHLSRVAVTGAVIRDKDPVEQILEYERHVVELNELDISLLRIIEEFQAPHRKGDVFREDEWIENVRTSWQEMLRLRGYGELTARGARSSLARLQSRGLIVQVAGTPTKNSPGTEPYTILDEGSLFLIYLKCEHDS